MISTGDRSWCLQRNAKQNSENNVVPEFYKNVDYLVNFINLYRSLTLREFAVTADTTEQLLISE